METLIKRPLLVILLGAVMCFYSILEFNIVLPLVLGISIKSGNIFISLMTFMVSAVLNLVRNPGLLIKVAAVILGMVIVLPPLIGAFLSGYLNVLNNMIEGRSRARGEFFQGIKMLFPRIYFITLKSALLTMLVGILFIVSCIPAFMFTGGVMGGKTQYIVPTVLVDIITLAVLFFGLMFFRIYVFFWYPAAVKVRDGAFKTGKSFVDKYFGSIIGKIIFYDIVFFIVQGILTIVKFYLMQNQMHDTIIMYLILILDWGFKTLFLTSFISYIFSFFKLYEVQE